MKRINRLLKAKNIRLASIDSEKCVTGFTLEKGLNRIQSAANPMKHGKNSFVETGSNNSFVSEPKASNDNVQVCIKMRPSNSREDGYNNKC
jgi:hypothetical protein